MRVLVVNAGSSSLKLSVLDGGDRPVAEADLDSPASEPDLDALGSFVTGEADGVAASGHRVVHGGSEFTQSVAVDDAVIRRIGELVELAPHNGPALAALATVQRLRPGLPAVACFDTTFHTTLPPAAARYGIPEEWVELFGVRRYGFHGLSHAYVARRAAELLGRPVGELRLVTCQLGAGASLAAVAGGRSVDTTMGFTPLDGLVMATRSGSVDPGALLWLATETELSLEEIERGVTREGGLLGLSGRSGDMRELLAAADDGDGAARLAVDVYVHRLRGGIASMAAAMGGVDAVAFAGGVGENSARIREDACAGLAFLGLALDAGRNAEPGDGDADLSAPGAPARALVVRTREDLEIAREVRRVVGG